ncbi:MAG: hypothetical protein E4H17_02805, partial [Gemmatimonadales bacterium]
LYVDRDGSGYDGDLLMSELVNDGSVALRAGALPPGDYYVYLRAVRHASSTLIEVARSGYSGRIRIGVPPLVTITAPAFTSGEDFATTELGNPWDFNDATDIQNTYEISSMQFSAGVLSAYADAPLPGRLWNDARIYLNLKRNGVGVPIDPKKYRYLTFRLRADPGTTVNMLDRLARGYDTRLAWYNSSYMADGTYSKAVHNLEDWRSYTVDLWDQGIVETGSNASGLPQRGWYALPAVRSLRFDPIEPNLRTRFWVDDIKLCAMNRPNAMGGYQIRWRAEDPDSQNLTVRVYRGAMVNGVYQENPTPLFQTQQAPGEGLWTWNTAGVPDGEYYIRVEVSDGAHVASQVSLTAISLPGYQGPNPGAMAVSGDYDGDGVSDLAVYHKTTGNWYIRPVAGEDPIVFGKNWGFLGALPVPGDYDGDGRDDLAVYEESTGNWFILGVTNNLIAFALNWGFPGTTPVPGDYDGDGKADLAVYERATGNWFIRPVKMNPGDPPLSFAENWGNRTMVPVPGNYDHESLSDMAVYQSSTGNWFIRRMGAITSGRPPICFGENWGNSSMVPVAGSYDANPACDQAVYQPSTGNWFIRPRGVITPSNPVVVFAMQWGGPGFQTVSGDYDGDGKFDLAVFHEALGRWYIRTTVESAPPIVFSLNWGW